jgi:methyl-accepting chemotaxis protein
VQHNGTMMEAVTQCMQGINRSSEKMSEIIGVIELIAFQTNILALNAAVEAARAGEQGKGFAVVAGEVRSLAQKSATAAKEIKELIGTSVGQIQEGGQLVERANTAMQGVVQDVGNIRTLMAEIAKASQEQSTGISQTNQVVAQIDISTQQNAALAEQSSAAAGTLEEQAAALSHAVGAFRLKALAG